jgi:hypothetical protein
VLDPAAPRLMLLGRHVCARVSSPHAQLQLVSAANHHHYNHQQQQQ